MTSTADKATMLTHYSTVDLALIDPISHHGDAETSTTGEAQDE